MTDEFSRCLLTPLRIATRLALKFAPLGALECTTGAAEFAPQAYAAKPVALPFKNDRLGRGEER
jgi:hypothetical protein